MEAVVWQRTPFIKTLNNNNDNSNIILLYLHYRHLFQSLLAFFQLGDCLEVDKGFISLWLLCMFRGHCSAACHLVFIKKRFKNTDEFATFF